jgi:putative oxidoreductase
MVNSNLFLLAGGSISALISLLHVLLAIKPELYQFIGSDQSSPIAQLVEQGSCVTTIASIILAAIFAVWAMYAFSGAGLIRRMPLLRLGLVTIAVIYLLRGSFLTTEITMVLNQGYPLRFVIFSTLSLLTGLLYLLGFLMRRKFLRPINKS